MKKETVNWMKVQELGYRRATRLRKLEHELVNFPEGISGLDLCVRVGIVSSSELKGLSEVSRRSKLRTLQNDLNELRSLYCGKQVISRSPHKLDLKDGDLAFPEAEFSSSDRMQLTSICRLIAFFDGAVPIKDVLKVNVTDVEEALKTMSDKIDISTNGKEIIYIKEIFEAIERQYVLDVVFPRLNQGETFPFAPYLLKRFNNKWFVIGKMYVNNPFDWTVIPLAAISKLKKHNGDQIYLPKKAYEIREIKQRIQCYYDSVLGFYVPTNETDPDKVPRTLDPAKLEIEDILIKCTPRTLRFIKENPIHRKQQIMEETSEVKLSLVINPLLIQRILGFGDEVEVKYPAKLREALKETISKMASKYKAN